MGLNKRKEKGGVGTIILYIVIISVVAMISLIVILNFFLTMPPPKSDLSVQYFIAGKKIDRIVCTIEENGYAYYDTTQSVILEILVEKNGKPTTNAWVTISGCGITSETSETDTHGYAHLNIRDIYLPPGIDKDKITVSVMGHDFELEVVRG